MARNDINIPSLISTLRRDDPRLHQALMELHRRTSGDNQTLVDTIIEQVGEDSGALITNAAFATAALVTGTQETSSINIGKLASNLMTITADFKCYVILYTSEAALQADELLRPDLPASDDPVPGAGVLGEFRFELPGDIIEVSPPVLLYGVDAEAPSPILWYRIFNEELTTVNISVTMRILAFL